MTLVERPLVLDGEPGAPRSVADLIIGGAQLGMAYGVANKTGQPSLHVSEMILAGAIDQGVRYLDTARAYGTSEQVIGSVLARGLKERVKVVTKLDPLESLDSKASVELAAAVTRKSVLKSCEALRAQSLDVLLLHRAAHLDIASGAVWRELLRLQQVGHIAELGVSVQSSDELIRAIREPEVSFVQLPYNLLDWRWDSVLPLLVQERSRRRLVVHARSAFLQGLLLSSDRDLWAQANCESGELVGRWLEATVTRLGRKSVADLCLSYVRSQPWIDGVVVGIETVEQLRHNLAHFAEPRLTAADLRKIREGAPLLLEATLNPARWIHAKPK